ncbi:hypothetical protein L873DRAFT_1803840 [Choiromyces venosus 120613-1]|uniref:Uncharacterized protein n=1 Tax=Choiromyces venosus 120613-1 TaxID=1336337 RepID=A0A3N4JSN5_9PEZI|nr:hypothetical protein L873DRAFT_1803840 [Choiromyces venosus 120613-1]
MPDSIIQRFNHFQQIAKYKAPLLHYRIDSPNSTRRYKALGPYGDQRETLVGLGFGPLLFLIFLLAFRAGVEVAVIGNCAFWLLTFLHPRGLSGLLAGINCELMEDSGTCSLLCHDMLVLFLLIFIVVYLLGSS